MCYGRGPAAQPDQVVQRRGWNVTRVDIPSAKVTIVFREGGLPTIDPADPAFVIVLGGLEIHAKVNPKAARKLAQHRGGAVLQGKLAAQADKLELLEAGFTWIDPKAEVATPERTEGGP
jgi:hypothetical protein